MFRRLAVLATSLILTACTTSSERAKVRGLTQDDAEHRKSLVADVKYKLTFFFEKESTSFRGESRIAFEMLKDQQDLTIDFNEGTVDLIQIDGEDVADFKYNDMFITIPGKYLAKGRREVTVQFEHPFSKTGAGMYRFKDPEDDRVYLYTDFEPYDANLLFPSFDQPDLRATYETTVHAPSNWMVFSSTQEDKIEKQEDGTRQWHFPESKPFSTYIYALIAGPYKVWKSKAGKIPLRLGARQSYAKHVDADKWFKITQQGFEFFNEYFDYGYPFGKYDQLIVPDFNAGAMENVAAVLFNETFFPKGAETESQAERRANVILHEMAHMWFGNLVTMKWWDDLWLNESFATFMATLALEKNTRFKRSWETFFARMKDWAYWEDQLVTTHPIVGEVKDTESAFVNFDGITYGKGASVLKQLNYFLSPEKFRDGVRAYFKKYAYKNTVMNDFVSSLGDAAGTDLGPWTEAWLMKASLNSIQVSYQCSAGKVSSFSLAQTYDDGFETLRPHKTNVGLFDKNGKLTQQQSVQYSEKNTEIKELVGAACPAFVYPNLDDHDFVKVSLDDQSLEWAKKSLNKLPSPFQRVMIWKDLWAMVRDAKLDYYTFLELVYVQLPRENDIKVAESVARLVRRPGQYLPGLADGSEKVAQSEKWQKKYEDLYWLLFKEAKPGSDFQKLWYDRVLSSAQTADAFDRIDLVLAGESSVNFTLKSGEDRRWNSVVALSRGNHSKALERLAEELKKDKSEKGKKYALAAEVARPNAATKQKWFDKIVQLDTDLSVARLRTAMQNLLPFGQQELSKTFVKPFFEHIEELSEKKEAVFMRYYAFYLSPQLCQAASSEALDDYISSNGSMIPVVKKALRVALQEDQRCQKIVALARTALEKKKNP